MTNTNPIARRSALLAEQKWDLEEIQARFQYLCDHDIPERQMAPEEIIRGKAAFLDRVQENAEQYCYLTRSCSKGSALALLEAFGLGNMAIIKSMAPFPGLSMTGGICGPVAGGLVALGLYFSDTDPANFENIAPYAAGRQYVKKFASVFGSLLCPDIQEQLLGRAYDPFASLEEYEAYSQAGAREKCPVAPGLGARFAAEIIVQSMEDSV